jgi:hypothetical protein
MIKFNELQPGDIVRAEFEGTVREGEVTRLNRDEKQVCVMTDVQEFWYSVDHLQPIPLSDEWLQKLNFTKSENDNGEVKYAKDAFRILLHDKNDFNNFEIWYREDRRHMNHPLMVHELQNHFLSMTKVHLTKEALV